MKISLTLSTVFNEASRDSDLKMIWKHLYFFSFLLVTVSSDETEHIRAICEHFTVKNATCSDNVDNVTVKFSYDNSENILNLRTKSKSIRFKIGCNGKYRTPFILSDLKDFNIQKEKDEIDNFYWKGCNYPNTSFLSMAKVIFNRDTRMMVNVVIEGVDDPLQPVLFRDTEAVYVELIKVNLNITNVFENFEIKKKLKLLKCLTPISSKIFEHQTFLKKLEIHSCQFDRMNFDGLENLTNLEIRSSGFKEFDEHGFEKLKSLTDLAMNRSPVNFTSNTFQSNKLLTVVFIRKSFHNLPDNLFANLPNLQIVALIGNEIKFLPDGLFNNSLKIMEIDLSSNELETISKPLFTGLPSLNRLVLHRNRLKSLLFLSKIYNLNPYRSSQKFLAIYANNNNLTDFQVPHLFESNIPLVYIEVKANNMRQISLPEYKMDYNNQLFSTQVILNYENNNIECSCRNYQFLNFIQNKKNDEIETISTIKTSSKCAEYPNEIAESFDLLKIQCEVKENCPTGCNCYTTPHNNSMIIDCSTNGFTEIPDYDENENISDMILKMKNNLLKTFLIDSRRKEVFIDVSNNSIESLKINSTSNHLKILNLSHNKLQILSNETLTALKTLKIQLYLTGNLWTCDCSTIDLLSFVISNPSQILDYDDLKCVDGKHFKNLSTEILCPGYEVEITLVAIVIAVIGIIFALYFKYQSIIKMWLYVNNYCSCILSDAEFEKDKRFDAFVMYSHKDVSYVFDVLFKELEEKQGYKLCSHERDWPVGPMITDLVSYINIALKKVLATEIFHRFASL